MNSIWKIKIHKLVLLEDFKSIDAFQQKLILKDIYKKLSLDPKNYGKPLLGELKGYWRLRVGDYRVVYKIEEEFVEVLVVKVGIRMNEEVYRDLFYRFKK